VVAKEGLPFVAIGILVSLLFYAGYYYTCWRPLLVASVIAAIFGIFCIYFFRDPQRSAPTGEGIVISPADGKVMEIVDEDNEHVGPGARRVTIFLSVFNVHINRIPMSGEVTAVSYNPGKFLMAFNEKASAENEQTHIAITAEGHTIAFKQIAGWIARRIICRLSPGDSVTIGERFGLIRFGSRVDVILPPGSAVQVKSGDRVRAGETIIGVLP
jgi:phosphatidylserine decarboxylase